MLRLRICKLGQSGPGILSWLRRNHSYQLLRTSSPPSPREIAVFNAIMYDLRLTTGIFRTTLPGRLKDLDRWVNGFLFQHFDVNARLRVEDWAASDCITSAEWFKSLEYCFPQVRMAASDLDLYLIEGRLPA